MWKLCVVVLTAYVGLSTATDPHSSFISEFTLLDCMVPNPRAGQRDQPDTKPEPVPIIPFHVVYDEFGSWFQPLQSRFVSPVSGEFSAALRNHLIDYFGSLPNIQLSVIGDLEPTTDPVLTEAPAGALIPQRIRLTGDGIGPIIEKLQNHTDEVEERLDELGITIDQDRDTIIQAHINLNDRCEVMPRWNRLPFGQFFPEWIYTSYCPIANCSLPPGLSCEPVVKKESIAHTLFLRWDCCYSLIGRDWVWQCGWRKVRLAYIGRCDCSCGVQYYGSDYIDSVSVGGPSERV